jgi:molecular chaperone HtpG
VSNMQEGQDTIFYISGDENESLADHPQLEKFREKNIDVLLFTDSVDNFWTNVLNQYKETNIQSVTRSNIDLDKINPEQNSTEGKADGLATSTEDKQKLIDYFKNLLKNVVKDVRVSKKLSATPACLAVDDGALDIRMEKFLLEQKQLKEASMKILEINVDHPILKNILNNINDDKVNEFTDNVAKIIFEQACIVEGEKISDILGFSKKLNH